MLLDTDNRLHIARGKVAPRASSLLIEGWRGINHSYALVNQHQLLALLQFDNLRLFHRDVPFAMKHWARERNGDGFSASERRRIDAIAPPTAGQFVDAVYRIAAPFRASRPGARTRAVTFMPTEFGPTLEAACILPDQRHDFTRGDDVIVTPSRWSRARLIEFGFPAEKVLVVPHGVDATLFRPLSAEERSVSRARFGLRDDETVFLNISGVFWNKGVDVLLRAFAELRQRGRRVRLILKDQRDIYRQSIDALLGCVGAAHPAVLDSRTLGAITVISQNMDRTQLRLLYGLADAYVSPYRAEGFNLPVLESIATGTRVIVTRGGATDDFCDPSVAVPVAARPVRRRDPRTGASAAHLEPDLEAVIAAMESIVARGGSDPAKFAEGRARVIEAFTWRRAASALARLTLEWSPPPANVAPPTVAIYGTSQAGVTYGITADTAGSARPAACY